MAEKDDEQQVEDGGVGDIPYLEDIEKIMPGGKQGEIWVLLEAGVLEAECVERGYNVKTVGIVAWKMEKAGVRTRPPKVKGAGKRAAATARLAAKGSDDEAEDGRMMSPAEAAIQRTMQTGGKAASPESIIDLMDFGDTGMNGVFTTGMKTGMSLIVLAVRMVQELSAVGVNQARPLISIAKEMRAGEAAAATVASRETAMAMSEHMEGYFGPALSEIGERMRDVQRPKLPEGTDPMKAMIARTMEPMMSTMMTKFMPGAAAPVADGGWKRTKK